MKCTKCEKKLGNRQTKFCSRECFFSSASWKKTQKKAGEVSLMKGTGVSKKEHDQRYYERNKEKLKQRMRNYYIKNKESLNASNKMWVENNREKVHVINKKWRENNKAQKQAWCYERRALKRKAIVADSDKEAIKSFYILAETLTIQMGEKYCVDHIKPLIKGGLHHQNNLQVITLVDNSRKGSKYPFKVEKAFIPKEVTVARNIWQQ
jgi:hypothetical protein